MGVIVELWKNGGIDLGAAASTSGSYAARSKRGNQKLSSCAGTEFVASPGAGVISLHVIWKPGEGIAASSRRRDKIMITA